MNLFVSPKFGKRHFINLLLACFLLSCGIDEYYYLPQIPEGNVNRIMNDSATVRIPGLSEHYANNYTIYYKIYISGENLDQVETSNNRITINPVLERDYNAIYPSTDPTNSTASTAVGNMFRNLNYYELELFVNDRVFSASDILSISGGTLEILFPGNNEVPYFTLNNGQRYYLYRSNGGGVFTPEPDRFFLNAWELTDNAKAINTINADVAANSTNPTGQLYTYVSMYIAAVGLNNILFTPIYSKPTFISIFKLPER